MRQILTDDFWGFHKNMNYKYAVLIPHANTKVLTQSLGFGNFIYSTPVYVTLIREDDLMNVGVESRYQIFRPSSHEY